VPTKFTKVNATFYDSTETVVGRNWENTDTENARAQKPAHST